MTYGDRDKSNFVRVGGTRGGEEERKKKRGEEGRKEKKFVWTKNRQR